MSIQPAVASEVVADAPEIVISRRLPAPRAVVFQAWIDPTHLARWWGPRGFTTTIQEADIRPGGVLRHVMRSYDGTEYPNRQTFLEITEPERIVYRADDGTDDYPTAFETTVTFVEEGGETVVTLRTRLDSFEARDSVLERGAVEGGISTLHCLEAYLATMTAPAPRSDREFSIHRVFDAPRELVFRAFSAPEHLVHWWGPEGWTLSVCNQDFRVGGEWHYCMSGPDGMESWGKAIYHEITPPARLVFLDVFSDAEGNTVEGLPQTVVTMEFIDRGGKTELISWAEYPDAEALQTVLDMGMVQGLYETWDRLAAYLTQG